MIRSMKSILAIKSLLVGALFLNGCAGNVSKNLTPSKPTSVTVSKTHRELTALPKPKEPIVVGVYKFKDQTGQFKPKENATSFSTAVTQGGTAMLIKAQIGRASCRERV